MNEPTQPAPRGHRCPVCGTVLPEDLPAEQCPKCLLRAGLRTRPAVGPEGTRVEASSASYSPALPNPGEQFGHYRIVSLLGQGGMGAVFEAEDLESGRRVALKILGHALNSPEARKRFLREGRLAASINHPNSIYVFGTEEIGDTPVIAMELVAGGTLQQRVECAGPLSVTRAVDAILNVIAGLEAAQALGILHRDIKPSNCFEDADGTVKIGDFGLSISTSARADTAVTVHGTVLGTPAYSSPEQLRGEELSVRSDIYSVGVTLFYLLTGRTPFEGRSLVQLIANVLDQPAPSPKSFRAAVPQELANLVSRCLDKQPGERFRSYQELRQALAPFSSTVPEPATLGLRFLAGMLDLLIAGLAGMMVTLLVFGNLWPFPAATTGYSLKFMLSMSPGFLLVILYYALLEGIRGASAGKAICRLRVVDSDRNPPGVAKALGRALIFLILPVLPYWVTYGLDPTRFLSTSSTVTQFAVNAFYYLVLALLFSTARRRNGFAAVHDFLTRTRVVRKMAYQARPVLATSAEVPPAAETKPTVGPYHVLESLEKTASDEWLVAYDTRLLRRVWIHVVQPGTAPVPTNRRMLGRPGRLRWIAGRRSAEENWDAFEGVTGQSFPSLLRERQPWSRVRFWLLDLATEINAAKKDGTLPSVLALDRVWITVDGRAKLLDFPAPGTAKAACPTDRPPASDAPPVLHGGHSAPEFLSQVARAALEGRILIESGPDAGPPAVPLPISVRRFLAELAALPGIGSVVETLKPLIHQAAIVSRLRRAGLIAGCAAFPLIAGAGVLVGTRMMERWERQQPGLWELSQLLNIRSAMNTPWLSQQAAPDDRLFEIYIASHHRSTITNSPLWSSLYALSMVKGANRKFAERSVAAHPHPTEPEVREAETAMEPILRHVRAPDFARQSWFPLLTCGVSWIVYVAIPALFAALLFRGGLVLRALRVAVVRQDGTPASRLRLLWRSAVAWSPVLLAPLVFAILSPALGMMWAAVVVVAAVGGLTLWSALLPERSLQDQIAGTHLVPR